MSKYGSKNNLAFPMSHQADQTVSVIIPAFNEAECIADVLKDVFSLKNNKGESRFSEVIVVDNGSTDQTATIAQSFGATVIKEPIQGYGQACWKGVQHATSDVLLFIDADGSSDVLESHLLLKAIEQGADLAIGTRTTPEAGSMSIPQRFGNYFACSLIRLIWQVPVTDLGPFRAITHSLYKQINMQDRAFGWTVEMQIKADQMNAEVRNIDVSWRRRVAGHSKISGTISGVFKAGTGILQMIFSLWWQQRKSINQIQTSNQSLVNFNPQTAPLQTRSRCEIKHSKEINI